MSDKEAPKGSEGSAEEPKVVSLEDHQKALQKVRSDEKGKLYPTIEALKTEKAELEGRVQTLAQDFETTKQELETLRKRQEEADTADLSEQEKLSRLIKQMEERVRESETKNATLQEQIQRVADEAAQRIAASELARYRAEKLRESGISLTELVTGNTPEEIDAAVSRAKEKEAAIFNKAREQIQREQAGNVPTPIAPGSSASNEVRVLDASEKKRLIKLSRTNPAEYERARAQLLAKARGG